MEQSYKEKYEQALERLKQWDREHPCAGYVLSDRDKFIFPELAESEDEKILEIIKHCIESRYLYTSTIKGISQKQCLAWLEKQSEQKPEENKGNIGGISSNSAWSEEDECYMSECIGAVATKDGWSFEEKRKTKHWLKSLQYRVQPQPKQEWSEEDEPQKGLAESYLAKFDEKFPILPTLKGKRLADYKNFLNKCQQIFGLKYWGIRPIQAKLFEKLSLLWAAWGAEHLQGLGQTDGDMDNEISMWSEEDEKIINGLIDSLTRISLNTRTDSTSPNYTFYKEIDWLKSLRPQNRWKPSDEQMEALDWQVENTSVGSWQYKATKELMADLKKLKEE